MKKLAVYLIYEMHGKSYIEVPNNYTLEEAKQYAYNNIDRIPTPENGCPLIENDKLVDEDEWKFE
nr:MAG TPA: hypothetical protein [Caudoviricetes sp.]